MTTTNCGCTKKNERDHEEQEQACIGHRAKRAKSRWAAVSVGQLDCVYIYIYIHMHTHIYMYYIIKFI